MGRREWGGGGGGGGLRYMVCAVALYAPPGAPALIISLTRVMAAEAGDLGRLGGVAKGG